MATQNGNPDAASSSENTTQKLITLRSSDLHEFSIFESAAVLSITIKKMLEDDWPEGSVIPLLNVDSKTLTTVIAYLNAYAATNDDDDDKKKKKFDDEFVFEKKINVLFEVVLVANYLNVLGLMDLVSENIADMIKNKSVEWTRKAFDVKNDYTAQEEAEIRSQNDWAFDGIDDD